MRSNSREVVVLNIVQDDCIFFSSEKRFSSKGSHDDAGLTFVSLAYTRFIGIHLNLKTETSFLGKRRNAAQLSISFFLDNPWAVFI